MSAKLNVARLSLFPRLSPDIGDGPQPCFGVVLIIHGMPNLSVKLP